MFLDISRLVEHPVNINLFSNTSEETFFLFSTAIFCEAVYPRHLAMLARSDSDERKILWASGASVTMCLLANLREVPKRTCLNVLSLLEKTQKPNSWSTSESPSRADLLPVCSKAMLVYLTVTVWHWAIWDLQIYKWAKNDSSNRGGWRWTTYCKA